MRSIIPRLVAAATARGCARARERLRQLASVAGPALGGRPHRDDRTDRHVRSSTSAPSPPRWSASGACRRSRRAGDADAPSLRSIAEGFRYVPPQQVLLGFLLVDSNAMVFGMPRALFPALAAHSSRRRRRPRLPLRRALRGRARLLAALRLDPARAAAGPRRRDRGGALGHRDRRRSASPTRSGSRCVLLAAAGAADNVSAVLRATILLTVTPDELRGRVSGIEFAQVASAPTLGNLEAGVVASLTSLRFSIVSGGLLCVIGTVVVAACRPGAAPLRREAPRMPARRTSSRAASTTSRRS